MRLSFFVVAAVPHSYSSGMKEFAKPMSEKIAILGAGGVGGVIGAYLARADHDVTLIDTWSANIDQIKEQGLRVTAMEGEFTVKAGALHLGEVSARQPLYDIAIVCVKAYDTRWATTFIEPYLAPGGFVVSAQNGVNEEAMADVIDWPRIVGCVVTISAGMYEPGHVERTNAADRQSFTLGEPSGVVSRRLERLAEIMSAAGPTKTTTNLWGERWAKLATNCMSNAVAGITGLRSSELRLNAEVRSVAIRIAGELLEVAGALGVSVERIGGIPAETYQQATADPTRRERLEQLIIEAGRDIGIGRPSLAQDVVKGRKTEVNELNGFIARKGRQVGIATPVNDAIVTVTRKVERGQIEPSLENLKSLEA